MKDPLLEALLPRLRGLVLALEPLLRELPASDLSWRPTEGAWSLAEIVGHLLDEERGDFRPRLAATLADPSRPWEPIAPERWVRERGHRGHDVAWLLDELARERAASLDWLSGLGPVDWTCTHVRTDGRRLSAGDLLAAWAAHDALHLAQVARRLAELVARAARPHDPGYATA